MENKKVLLSVMISIVALMFMMGNVYAAQSAVSLGTAGNFVILTKSGISTTGTTAITGDIGTSPLDGTGITGFGLIMDSSNRFSTSSLVTGKIYAADYTSPTATILTTAVSDMETAYTDAAGRTLPTATELGAGEIGGMTLAPGLYKWGTGVLISTDVTLSGSSTDVWIFQIAGTLDIASATQVKLAGGAQAKNIFWQVADATTLGTTSVFNGNILCLKEIVLNTGAVLNGRALSQTAVTMDSNSVTISSPLTITPTDSNPVSPSTNGNSEPSESSSGSNPVITPSTGAVVSITTPKANITIVSGVSVTITRDGKTILVNSVNGRTRLTSDNVKVETNLSVKVGANTIHVTQSNGANSEVKIMPSTASETALAKLRLKVCDETNNCTIILKEVKVGKETKLAYQMKAKKDVKIIGLFKAKMNVETNVDAQTGEVISTNKPWWAFLAKEEAN